MKQNEKERCGKMKEKVKNRGRKRGEREWNGKWKTGRMNKRSRMRRNGKMYERINKRNRMRKKEIKKEAE
jgi:hypothetical protein